MIKVATIPEVWELAYKLADAGEYELDKDSEEGAVYPIFREKNSYYSRICDLGCRLEIMKADETSTNIWIEPQEPAAEEELRAGYDRHWRASHNILITLEDFFAEAEKKPSEEERIPALPGDYVPRGPEKRQVDPPASIALHMLIADYEGAEKIYSAATKKDQAKKGPHRGYKHGQAITGASGRPHKAAERSLFFGDRLFL